MVAHFINLLILTVVACEWITVSARDDDRQQAGCVESCDQVVQRQYRPLCKSCRDYCFGTGPKKCVRGKEWHSNKNECVPYPSPTCKYTTTSTKTSTTTSTTTTSKSPVSNEQIVVDDKSAKEYKNSTHIDQDGSSVHITSRKTAGNRESLPHKPDKILCSHSNEPKDESLLKWIPCQYVLLMSGLLGSMPIVICLFCHISRNRRKMKRKMLSDSGKFSVSTQTPDLGPLNPDSDSAIYDDLIPYERNDCRDRYTLLPNVNNNNQGYYNNILLSMLERGEGDYTHDYLELLPACTYLQMQDVETRKEVANTLVPLIKDLCDQYRKDPNNYRELEEKLDKCVKNV